MSKRNYTIATRLHAAMGKGFLDYATLTAGLKTETGATIDVSYLMTMISDVRRLVEPIGLRIGAVPKMGYYMMQANDITKPPPKTPAVI